MYIKKMGVLLIALILLISGCSNTGNRNTSSQNTLTQSGKGRFMESNISLPKEIDTNANLQLTKKDGLPYLYSFTGDNQLIISGFRMNQDGSWTEDTPEWLKKIQLPISPDYRDVVLEDATGNQYLYYIECSDDIFKAKLLKSSDGIAYETLAPEGWDEKDPKFDSYYIPEEITMLEDGTLVGSSGSEISFYNSTSMKIDYNITNTDNNNVTLLTTSGQNLIVGQFEQKFKLSGIDVYDTKKGYAKTTYPFKSKIEGNAYLDTNDNKNIILCNPDGMHILEENTSVWQTVVDGTLTSLAMQTMWNTGFIAGSDGNYYVLYNSDNGYTFIKYSFDETIASVPSTELTIYSLKDNVTLRQAAALFQQKHPDVRVNFTFAMTTEEYETSAITTREDYIKTLNTELIAGGGTDILILDGLPTDSYVEKGVLTDMSDVIKPMLDKGELLSNILNPYIKEDKIYSAPIRFEIPLLCGRNEGVKALSTIEYLADYVTKHDDKPLFGNVTLEDYISMFSPYITSKIIAEDGEIKKENLIAFLSDLKVIADNSGIIEEYTEDGYIGNKIWELPNHIQLCLDSPNGFMDSMFSLSIVNYVNGDFIPFENAYIPVCEIGINGNSKQKELSKEFISFVFSEEIGKEDLVDGFPVNAKALTLCSQNDRTKYESYSQIENVDGSFSEIAFKDLNPEQLDIIMNACSSVNKRAATDTRIDSVFLEETTELFKGNSSVEETANRIIEKISLYLSE